MHPQAEMQKNPGKPLSPATESLSENPHGNHPTGTLTLGVQASELRIHFYCFSEAPTLAFCHGGPGKRTSEQRIWV